MNWIAPPGNLILVAYSICRSEWKPHSLHVHITPKPRDIAVHESAHVMAFFQRDDGSVCMGEFWGGDAKWSEPRTIVEGSAA